MECLGGKVEGGTVKRQVRILHIMRGGFKLFNNMRLLQQSCRSEGRANRFASVEEIEEWN
jgi:hypothetical protein